MKKFVSLLLALMMALSLVACGSKADTTTDDKTDDDTVTEPANALEKIKADGVLTVALSPDFSPMEFVDSSKTGQDQYVGFDITLAKYIAENLGVELVIEPMGFDASQTAVYTGSVPMSISGYSWTEDRAQNYELSDYYYAGENETRQALLIKKENADKYTSPEDLAGQDVVFDVTINAIEEQVDAEWNDAFVQKNTDYETVDEYVAATKESLQQQKDSDKAYYVMEAIVNDSEFEYADSDVQALVDTQKQQYEQYASYFGMSLDDFLSNSGMTDEKLEENARFQIGCTLAIDAIGKAENMTVSDEEYQSGLEELASQYGAESGEAFEEQYGKEDVENSILYDKIMDYVVDQAVVK